MYIKSFRDMKKEPKIGKRKLKQKFFCTCWEFVVTFYVFRMMFLCSMLLIPPNNDTNETQKVSQDTLHNPFTRANVVILDYTAKMLFENYAEINFSGKNNDKKTQDFLTQKNNKSAVCVLSFFFKKINVKLKPRSDHTFL
jgi:hypothetical protein